MKYFFIDAKYNKSVILKDSLLKELPKKLGLITTIQFTNQILDIKNQLEKLGHEVYISKGIQKYDGQVLGCESSAANYIKEDVDAFFYVGTGRFHILNAAMETGKKLYSYNPISNQISVLDEKDLEKLKKRRKGALMKYYSSSSIGIIVTTKPGQNDIKSAFELKEKLRKDGKKAYIFIDNTYNLNSLEDFNFIDSWVNTACPRIVEDFSSVNIRDVL